MKRTLARLVLACLVSASTGLAAWADGPIPATPVSPTPQPGSGMPPAFFDSPWFGSPGQGNPSDSHPVPAGDGGCGSGLAERDPFTAGTLTLQFMTGYFPKAHLGPNNIGGSNTPEPALDYLPQALRIGIMCNDPHPDRLLFTGVVELLLEGYYAPIVRTFGNYITGPDAILRYNFVRPHCLFVPYIQGGAGFAITDAWKNPDQHLIGEEFEFYLRAEVGVRCMITENFSFDIEGGYQHISNADLAPRNAGLNCLGISIGFTYFFR